LVASNIKKSQIYFHNDIFLDDSEILVKPVTCFDTNANDRIICAGSEEINNDVYLLFFDIRERRFMGGFVDSHNEEITDVKFHPTKNDFLATGSSDGLINIFDCKKESEEDSLQFTLNTCDSVNKLMWHADEKISCITNTNDLHLYDIESQDLLKKYERADITSFIKRKSTIDCHVVDTFNVGSEMMFLATSNYNKGECLRSVKFNETKMSPLANLCGNSQIIRSSLYDENRNIYLTFGENAIITVWSEGEHVQASNKSTINLKEDSSLKKKSKKKVAPY
jgi:WD repeat-containing protein 89